MAFNIFNLNSFITFCFFFALPWTLSHQNKNGHIPIVINTWPFTKATDAAWTAIVSSGYLAAVEAGCRQCQTLQCDGTVGWGGSPDEKGETTQDAMIMDGVTHNVGAVAGLREIKDAIGVARAVMDHTGHTLLVGDLATDFAVEMGFTKEDLHSNTSRKSWMDWMKNNCQPNFWKNVFPDPKKSCGPYKPRPPTTNIFKAWAAVDNHDTIGIVTVDASGNIAAGASSNGANHKIPGRVGDAPIMGAGAYADQNAGAAAATGDGDVMMRFLPSYHTVTLMGTGINPSEATAMSISKIAKFYPDFSGALIAVNTTGGYGAACHGFGTFHYSIRSLAMSTTKVLEVPCI